MDLVTMLLACSLASDNSITKAMVDLGSKNEPLMVSVVGGESKTFPTEAAATTFAKNELQQGHEIKIGLMQIPSRWLDPYHLHVGDMFKPCKNMVIATRIVNELREQCLSMKRMPPITDMQACALSTYETGDPQKGLDFANKIMDYAKAHPFVPPEPKIDMHPKPKPEVTEKSDEQKGEQKSDTTNPTPADNQNAQH